MELNTVYNKADLTESSLSPGLSQRSREQESLVDLYIDNANDQQYRSTPSYGGVNRSSQQNFQLSKPMGDQAIRKGGQNSSSKKDPRRP